jgi:hypothetical protein
MAYLAGRDIQLKDRVALKKGDPYPGFEKLIPPVREKLLKLKWVVEGEAPKKESAAPAPVAATSIEIKA